MRPTDSPRHPETHPPTRTPTATPVDPPVSISGARSPLRLYMHIVCACARVRACMRACAAAHTRTVVVDALPVSGFVKSALNGQGMAGVQLTFSSGPNAGKSVRGGFGAHALSSTALIGMVCTIDFASRLVIGRLGPRRLVHVPQS
jgi:hypothetical protein